MKSFSLSVRLVAPMIIISTVVTLGLSAAVFTEMYFQSIHRQKEHIFEYVRLKSEADGQSFRALSDRDRAATQELLAMSSDMDTAAVDREFDRLYPLRPDGTRRSADFLFEGGRTSRGEMISGVAAFIHDGAHLSQQQKRYLLAAADVVYDYGRAGMGMADNFYFFTPRMDVVIYAPKRPDRLMFYRRTAPPNLDMSQEEIHLLTLKGNNPQRTSLCTGLRRILNDDKAKRVLAGCITPIDVNGEHIGSMGTTAPMEAFVRQVVDNHLPDATNVIVSADGRIVAHPGTITPGVVTSQEAQSYGKSLDLPQLMTMLKGGTSQSGVYETRDARYLVAYGRLNGPGWYSLTVSPTRALNLQAIRSATDIFLLALLAAVVQSLAIYFLLRRTVVRPLETLAERSRNPQSAPSARSEEARTDEIGELARSLSFERARNNEILRTLEDRVSARTRELEEANEEKSRFLANMSHELRTPLNGIVAVSDMLFGLQVEDRGRECAEIIRSSALTLERVVSDVLDYSKIEAGQIDLEAAPFNVSQFLSRVAKPFAIAAEAKSVLIHTEIAPGVHPTYLGDAHRLAQVLNNLIGNAVKFTEKGEIKVQVEPDLDGLVFRVRDSGIGFSNEVRERLFARFAQGDSSITRRYGGTGLGLAICSSLVRIMGGAISAFSSEGEGATFEVRLPLKACEPVPEAAHATGLADPHAGAEGRLCVLLAEDNPTNQRVVELILQSAEVDLVMVENGRLAVQAYEARRFDCILMDMQMPEMDGIEAIRRIREMERSTGRPHTPIICVSANALAEHVAASRLAGADSHLAKPFRPQALLEALSSQLSA
jgi:signal transduction histidine kinase/CheY-like chemotaxis protein